MDSAQQVQSFYAPSLTQYRRWKTRPVQIGDVALGGDHPIRVQSMTVADTMDTRATVQETFSLWKAGCDYVRITAPSLKEAQNLQVIKKELQKLGCPVPLIADIHFTPNAAELAARIVEKVRVNPGNYADKKKFEHIEYTQDLYQAELDRIRERFSPLVKICKEYGTAMRIGTNHGSLSDRIMSRYGDTPLGMVESAMEFVRICRDLNYHELVLSMKASNPQVMVQAYRLLVKTMRDEGMNYPLHLGVTEAGDGPDGRIKSAAGIGTLLEDGLGDTIRVSLTESSLAEVPVARALADRYTQRSQKKTDDEGHLADLPTEPWDPYTYERKSSRQVLNLGGDNVPRVLLHAMEPPKEPTQLKAYGFDYRSELDKFRMDDLGADMVVLDGAPQLDSWPGSLPVILPYKPWQEWQQAQNVSGDRLRQSYPLLDLEQFRNAERLSTQMNFLALGTAEITGALIRELHQEKRPWVLMLSTESAHAMPRLRQAVRALRGGGVDWPLVLELDYRSHTPDEAVLYAATDAAGLLLDGWGQGLLVHSPEGPDWTRKLIYGILQATRMRISRTEYISCPSCGRTLFDLQETTQTIRQRTDHLKGLKIGIMGCIVNGPGEMADADYGYVGTGPGKITLFRGKEVVKRNVDSAQALDHLIDLIREDGKWVEPELAQTAEK